jgi:hypothetical protein
MCTQVGPHLPAKVVWATRSAANGPDQLDCFSFSTSRR